VTRRILVVDDSAPWRRFVTSRLETSGDYEIVGELADGHGVVDAVARLKPDLTLLDIGLPSRSGIEVAALILAAAADSKILFLSEHRAAEIAAAALATGAQGYVVKSDADHDLLPAIDAVLHGRRFVSTRVDPRLMPARTVPKTRTAWRHEIELRSNATPLWDSLSTKLERALRADCAVILVAGAATRDVVHRTLQSRGLDMARAAADGRYVPLDVTETLATFMVSGSLDEALFWESATELFATARRASTRDDPHVVACGECAPVLWRNGQAASAVRLEQLWTEVASTQNVDVLCGYSVPAPLRGEERQMFQQICALHSAVHAYDGHRGLAD
jgi:DNA-binding NarL/FixJ family response regulator